MMKIAFDTNYLLNEDLLCVSLINRWLAGKPLLFKLALDAKGEIAGEYAEFAEKAPEESLLRCIWARVADDLSLGQVTTLLDCDSLPPDLPELKIRHLNKPIEPELFRMGCNYDDVLVWLFGRSPGHKARGYCHHYNYVTSQYLKHNERLLKELMEMMTLPSCREALALLLEERQITGRVVETERLELKESISDTGVEKIARTASVMLNETGGNIFIGIRDGSGEITGVNFDDLRWADTGKAMEFLATKVNSIRPSPADLISTTPIKMDDGKIVIGIHIKKGETTETYCYGGWKYGRNGNTTSKVRKCPE